MYTIVYHDEDLNLIDTIETHSIQKVGKGSVPFYIQEGAFDGVVDPSNGIDTRSQVEILQEENEKLRTRVQSTEDAFFQFMMNNSEVPII